MTSVDETYTGYHRVPSAVPSRTLAWNVYGKGVESVGRDGRPVFAMRARAHTVVLPERSFLRSALRDRQPAFVAAVRTTLASVIGPGTS